MVITIKWKNFNGQQQCKLACHKWEEYKQKWKYAQFRMGDLYHTPDRSHIQIHTHIYTHTKSYIYVYVENNLYKSGPEKVGISHDSRVQHVYMLHAAYKIHFWQTLCWWTAQQNDGVVVYLLLCFFFVLFRCWYSLLIVKVIDIVVVHMYMYVCYCYCCNFLFCDWQANCIWTTLNVVQRPDSDLCD